MAPKLYKKTIDIWITHICLYSISWDLANVLGTWTSLLKSHDNSFPSCYFKIVLNLGQYI